MAGGKSEVAVQVVVPLHLRRPLRAYLGLLGGRDHTFLLESSLKDPRLGRYSFLAGEPVAVLSARSLPTESGAHAIRLSENGEQRTYAGDAVRELSRWLAKLRPLPTSVPAEIPFLGGAVGYFGYEFLAEREQIPFQAAGADAPPDMLFGFVDEVLAVDHQESRAFLAVTGRAATEARAEWRAELRVFELIAALRRIEAQAPRHEIPDDDAPSVSMASEVDEAAYRNQVELAKEHIRSGDAFEVCLTRRIRTDPTDLSAYALYLRLCQESPAPFAAYLGFPEVEIVAASPERFLHLDPNGQVESRPIKGTRPRGDTTERDLELRNDLVTSKKDRAENLMIVDLVRSDLGRVAELGSVRVRDLLRVEAYETVYQLVSTVQAQLLAGLDIGALIEATFPGGSMTGAPKIEAMKIIHDLEISRRGVYSGALGYLDYRGGAELAMVIRSAIKVNGRFELGVGGAVVSDSDPAAEWQESEDKALALVRAFQRPAKRRTKAVGATP